MSSHPWSDKIMYKWPVGTLITYEDAPGWVSKAETEVSFMKITLKRHGASGAAYVISPNNCHLVALVETNPYDLEPLT